MLETPKANSTNLGENLLDETMGNQQATCESRESSTTTRATLVYNHDHYIIVIMDKELINKRVRAYRKRTKNASTRKYEKTVNGFLMRKYRNMESRVKGIQKLKKHLYSGKDILSRKDFYSWANRSKDFFRLYQSWVDSGYNRKLCPTVDRIDSKSGYHLSNMRWVTHSENSRFGNLSRFNKMKI